MMWKDKYRIGVEHIDQQHEELFQRVSSFLAAVQHEGSWAEKMTNVKETMDFMQQYVIEHFQDEEAYQQEIGYPDHEAHSQEHQRFQDAVSAYVERIAQEGCSEQLLQEFGGKLMTWLIMHVAASDQKLGSYVQHQGGGADES